MTIKRLYASVNRGVEKFSLVMHFSLLRYGVAVFAIMLAPLVKQLLDSLIFGQKSPFLVLLAIAVIVNSRYGGMRAGLFANVLAAFFQAYQNFEREFHLLLADREYRWIVDRGTPRFTPDGSFVGYIGSCTDITEQKSTEQALRERTEELANLSAALVQTNASLEKHNRELDQFAYIVSHDLKAPLRAIAHLSSWLEEDIQDQFSEETRHQMDLLRGRVNRLEALIDCLLLYSRLGRVKTPAELVSVRKLLATVINSLAPPPEFTIAIEEFMPSLDPERTLLEQVFANLISNGIKHHNRPDGHVTIQDREDVWAFAVADDGLGIEPRIITKFL